MNQWLIHWKGKTTEEATWEDEVSIRSQFPELSLEDKTILQEESIDKAQRMSGLPQPQAHDGTKAWWGKVYVRKKDPRVEVAGS